MGLEVEGGLAGGRGKAGSWLQALCFGELTLEVDSGVVVVVVAREMCSKG